MEDHWADLERLGNVPLTRDQVLWTADEAERVWERVYALPIARELRKFVYRRVHDWEVADEILQSCLGELASRRGYRCAGSGGSVRLFRGYIYASLRNTIADYFEEARRSAAWSFPMPVQAGDKRVFERRVQLKLQLESAMEILDNRSRFVVREKHEGLTHIEIAEQLGLGVDNVRTIYSRAMRKLRSHLKESI